MRAPWSRPGVPRTRVAPCRPLSSPAPPGSTPTSRTDFFGHKGVEDPDRVASAPHARHDHIGEPAELTPPLPFGLAPDDCLKIPDQAWKGMRSRRRPEQVVRIGEAPGPIAQRFVDRVLQGAGPRGDGNHFGAAQLHSLHVGGLARHVLCPHVDHRPHIEPRRDHRRRDPMLTGAGPRRSAGSCPCAGPGGPARARYSPCAPLHGAGPRA